jgi:hypothetical protein
MVVVAYSIFGVVVMLLHRARVPVLTLIDVMMITTVITVAIALWVGLAR